MPFCTPSVQVGTAHWFSVQTPLVQSSAAPQLAPSIHGEHVPPQSMSVSLPFRTPSLQTGT
jgi:hypothetical protein